MVIFRTVLYNRTCNNDISSLATPKKNSFILFGFSWHGHFDGPPTHCLTVCLTGVRSIAFGNVVVFGQKFSMTALVGLSGAIMARSYLLYISQSKQPVLLLSYTCIPTSYCLLYI